MKNVLQCSTKHNNLLRSLRPLILWLGTRNAAWGGRGWQKALARIYFGVIVFTIAGCSIETQSTPGTKMFSQKHFKFTVPQEFYENRDNVLKLYDKNYRPLGEIDEVFLSFRRTLQLKDPNGYLVAEARVPIFAFGDKIEIFNETKTHKIGEINGFMFQILGSISMKFDIYDENGKKIAIIETENATFFETEININDSKDGHRLAVIKETPFRRVKGFLSNPLTYRVTQEGTLKIRPEILVFIAADITLLKEAPDSN